MSLIKEETEVKKDLKEAILGIEVTQFDGQKADLEELVNPKQLEKIISYWMPDVLSQEFIDEHEIYIHDSNRSVIKAVPVDRLQNLLVPKEPLGNPQKLEKVQIPQFVADWVEKANRYHSISWLLNYENIKEWSHELTLWCFESGNDDNLHKLARAWLDGYTVEEPKYVIKISENLYLAEPLGDTSGNRIEVTRDKEDAYRFKDKQSIETHLSKFSGAESEEVE